MVGLLVIAVAISVAILTSKVSADTDGNYEYTVNAVIGDVMITNYLGSETAIVIPNKLGAGNVVFMGMSAFENKGIISVKLPHTIKRYW